jgi:hypothetical protein
MDYSADENTVLNIIYHIQEQCHMSSFENNFMDSNKIKTKEYYLDNISRLELEIKLFKEYIYISSNIINKNKQTDLLERLNDCIQSNMKYIEILKNELIRL